MGQDDWLFSVWTVLPQLSLRILGSSLAQKVYNYPQAKLLSSDWPNSIMKESQGLSFPVIQTQWPRTVFPNLLWQWKFSSKNSHEVLIHKTGRSRAASGRKEESCFPSWLAASVNPLSAAHWIWSPACLGLSSRITALQFIWIIPGKHREPGWASPGGLPGGGHT